LAPSSCKELGLKWKNKIFGKKKFNKKSIYANKKENEKLFNRFPANTKYKTVWNWLASFVVFVLLFTVS